MLSLFADQEREAKLDSLGDPLALLSKHVDFATMAVEIDRWVPRPSQAKGGRPPYPTELMTRLLVLQHLFNLSDEQMEFQLLDRMSFQRFAGLQNSARVPDRNTIWNFRERLVKAKVEHQAPGRPGALFFAPLPCRPPARPTRKADARGRAPGDQPRATTLCCQLIETVTVLPKSVDPYPWIYGLVGKRICAFTDLRKTANAVFRFCRKP